MSDPLAAPVVVAPPVFPYCVFIGYSINQRQAHLLPFNAAPAVEHAPDPHATMRDMLTFAHAHTRIVFTTPTQPDDIELRRAAWWYIAPRNGHVSIHSERSLDALAAAHGLYFLKGDAFHIFSQDFNKAHRG